MTPLIECVPNFSEGRRPEVIDAIARSIRQVDGARLLDVDPGQATNRTVMTIAGAPEAVIEAAFQAIRTAAELIDMRSHSGEHPRMGATDVCPLIPIRDITMEDTIRYARQLAERVGRELSIPVYLYESAATSPERKNLADIRAGEYEGLSQKLANPAWKPDFGPAEMNATAGATVIGARDFLIAYNLNLNTRSTRKANSVAFDIREKGRVKRIGHPVTGEIVRDATGEPVREEGLCKGVKAIGWYIEEYGIAQVSMNITDIAQTSLHDAFEAGVQSATARGLRITGSELVGLVPLEVMLEAGRHFLRKQEMSAGVSDSELIHIAVRSMGLDELSPFDPQKKIIEYLLADDPATRLAGRTLEAFSAELATDSPAPGGGSAAAYAGALAASLGAMVANLSAHKRGWEDRQDTFSAWAVKGQEGRMRLLYLVDEDTEAFNRLLTAFRMPKDSDAEKKARSAAIQEATRYAIHIPLETIRAAVSLLDLLDAMVREGNPTSVSDAGVGALLARAAAEGGWLNVRINLSGLKDKAAAEKFAAEADALLDQCKTRVEAIVEAVKNTIDQS